MKKAEHLRLMRAKSNALIKCCRRVNELENIIKELKKLKT